MVEPTPGFAQSVLDVLYFRNPMGEFLLYLMFGLATVGALAGATALRTGHRGAFLQRYAARVIPAYPYLLLFAGITLAIGLEALVEERFTAWLGWDFTPLAFAIEGRAVEVFQRTLHESVLGPVLDAVLILVYTWGSFLLGVAPIFILAFTGRIASLRRLTFTLGGIWAVGLVFYLFVPVYEVWVTAGPPYHYTSVRNLLLENSPGLTDATIYRVNLNNNFPSMHTGIAVAVTLALGLAREKWLFRIAVPVASGIVVATLYLGIHWIIDVIAGIALAGSVAWWVHRKEEARATATAAA